MHTLQRPVVAICPYDITERINYSGSAGAWAKRGHLLPEFSFKCMLLHSDFERQHCSPSQLRCSGTIVYK